MNIRNKTYGLMAINTYSSNATYWQNTVTSIIFSSFYILLRVIIWQALYQSVEYAAVAGRTLSDMVTYAVVANLVNGLAGSNGVAGELEERMKSGEIGLDFLRPVSPRLMLLARNLGGKLYWLLYNALPTTVLAVLIMGGIALPPSGEALLMFVAAVIGGYCISVIFELLMACFAFWFVNVHTLSWFVEFFMLAMSGVIVPLWFLPEWLQNIAMALPFQAIVYTPMQLYMGTLDTAGALGALALQAGWILGLGILQQILWRKGVRRIVVHGG